MCSSSPLARLCCSGVEVLGSHLSYTFVLLGIVLFRFSRIRLQEVKKHVKNRAYLSCKILQAPYCTNGKDPQHARKCVLVVGKGLGRGASILR